MMNGQIWPFDDRVWENGSSLDIDVISFLLFTLHGLTKV